MSLSSMGGMPSVMGSGHSFSQVPQAMIPRSVFNRSFGYKTTLDADYLVPFFCDEVLPGDTMKLKATVFARMATPIIPVMDNLYLDSFYFFVPYRLLWVHWEKFNGAQDNPGDSTSFTVPQVVSTNTGAVVGSWWDYFGLPLYTVAPGVSVSALPFRAMNLIYNEWFRDQNLINSVTFETDDGPDPLGQYLPLLRGKRHDYFTSCLPWPQKGPSVALPLGTTAPILGISKQNRTFTTGGGGGATGYDTQSGAGTVNYPVYQELDASAGGTASTNWYVQGSATTGNLQLFADLTHATAATINSLRLAFQTQKMYERDARGGTRYTEIIRSHFGVISPDMRLQRPEYLGGGSQQILFTPVAQTSATGLTGSSTPQGNLAAIATVQKHGDGFVRSFTEHGVIIGIVNIRADITYQYGINRMWSRSTRFDFYWPALSHIGEQAVLNQEIYPVGTNNAAQDIAVFGYQERYAEYRYKPSMITGQFRSNYSIPLDIWHFAQKFTSLPVLNNVFIGSSTPTRAIAVPNASGTFLLDAYFNYSCARPMPTYSVPGLIDHF